MGQRGGRGGESAQGDTSGTSCVPPSQGPPPALGRALRVRPPILQSPRWQETQRPTGLSATSLSLWVPGGDTNKLWADGNRRPCIVRTGRVRSTSVVKVTMRVRPGLWTTNGHEPWLQLSRRPLCPDLSPQDPATYGPSAARHQGDHPA